MWSFLISKIAFDKVSLPGLLHKLQAAGLCDRSFVWCRSFLIGRKQRVRVGNQVSDLKDLKAGIPQGAILSPLLFSLYINDIVECAEAADFNLFADDTSAYVVAKSAATLQSQLQTVLDKMSVWLRTWSVSVNFKKTALLVLSTKRSIPAVNISLDGHHIEQVSSHKHLGVVCNNRLRWSDHTTYLVKKASKKIGLLRRFRRRLPELVVRRLYQTCIRPALEYAGAAWSGIGAMDNEKLERVQRSAARLVARLSAREDISHELLLARAGLEPLRLRRLSPLATTVLKLTWKQPRGPDHLVSAYKGFCSLSPPNTSQMSLRGDDNTRLPRARTEYLRHSPFYMALKFLLSLPASCKKSLSALRISSFITLLIRHLACSPSL